MAQERLFGPNGGREASAGQRPEKSCGAKAKLKPINRAQMVLRTLDVEQLIPPNHRARAIWALTERLDVTPFLHAITTHEGEAGAPAWDPRLLLSVWVYAYSEGITSAREIERLMECEPGLMWLSGLGVVNHHTVSDFRTHNREALERTFAELLVVLEDAGWVDLRLVAVDGTKIQAQAGADTFRTARHIAERIEQIRAALAELAAEAAAPGGLERREQMREQILREQLERLAASAEVVKAAAKQRASKNSGKEPRASVTEPDAQVMKTGTGGYVPAYNVQIATDGCAGVVVDVALVQAASDAQQLMPAVERVEARTGRKPEQVVADGGYTTGHNITAMANAGIDFIGSRGNEAARARNGLKSHGIAPEFGPSAFVILNGGQQLRCPAGKRLDYWHQSRKHGLSYKQYRAATNDCASCPHAAQCCPKSRCRTVSLRQETAAMAEFKEKMKTEPYRALYRKRGPLAEFVNLCFKAKYGLRKFRLRGLAKAGTEALWAALTYNACIWARRCWPIQNASAAA